MATCSIPGCDKPAISRGWCPKHYYRWRTHGRADFPTVQDLTTEERFWQKVNRQGDSDCWLWTSSVRGDGYGAFQVESTKQISAHRYSYQLRHGEIPPGMVVMHSCDVPLCVNPNHLSLGTTAENAADASRKGRRLPGSKNHQAKLDEKTVREIRTRYAAGGTTQRELALAYDVSPALIGHIVNRRSWRHI